MNAEEKVEDAICTADPTNSGVIQCNSEQARSGFLRAVSNKNPILKNMSEKYNSVRTLICCNAVLNQHLGHAKYVINQTQSIPAHKMFIIRKKRLVRAQGETVITTNSSGTLKYLKFEDMQEQVTDLMNKWSSTN